MTNDWGGRATLRADQAQRVARTARDRAREIQGFHAVPADEAGLFRGHVRWAHPLDYLVEACDPHTGKPWLTQDEHDAAIRFARLFHRAGIIRAQPGAVDMAAGGGGEQTDGTASLATQWRRMARRLGDCANLAIDVCCLAKMPSPAQARRLARGLDRLL